MLDEFSNLFSILRTPENFDNFKFIKRTKNILKSNVKCMLWKFSVQGKNRNIRSTT